MNHSGNQVRNRRVACCSRPQSNSTNAEACAPYRLGVIPPGFQRAKDDFAAGRLWKARDRLHGLVRANPTNEEMFSLLGDVYFEMGDLPQAGRYWYLTIREGVNFDEARNAFEQRFGTQAAQIIEALPVYARWTEFEPEIRQRLGNLIESAGIKSQGTSARWTKDWWFDRPRREPSKPLKPLDKGWTFVVAVLVVLLTVGVWVTGAMTLVRALLGQD